MNFRVLINSRYHTCIASLVAYHGTIRGFDKLALDKKKTSDQLYGNGIYFTSSQSSANSFAAGRYGRVLTVDLSSLKIWDTAKDLKVANNIAHKLGVKLDLNHHIKDGYHILHKALSESGKSKTQIIRLLVKGVEAQGYDGISIPFSSSEIWYVVYRNIDKIEYISSSPYEK